MPGMHEARHYERLPAGVTLCTLCPHRCRIRPGGRGACAVRFNDGGTLYTVVGERVVARHVDPVEKKPLFHFFPGSRAYSVATVGCNLSCAFCQNWQLAHWPRQNLPKGVGRRAASSPGARRLEELASLVAGEPVTPRELVDAARAAGCCSIAYTYTEPAVFYELAYETATLARAHGLKNVFVTNGFFSEAPLREIAAVLDAVNVDLKFFSEDSYRRLSRARLAPVLDAIRLYRDLGVWVEVTTLVIPGVNDSDDELGGIARFVRSVGEDVPWHVSRFFPAYRMKDVSPTPLGTIQRALAIGADAGLRYVYAGNLPGDGDDSTRCHRCRTVLVQRGPRRTVVNRAARGCCPSCGAQVAGVGMAAPEGRA